MKRHQLQREIERERERDRGEETRQNGMKAINIPTEKGEKKTIEDDDQKRAREGGYERET